MKPLLLVLPLALMASADPVTFRIQLAKGKSWKVEQTVGLTSDAPPPNKLKGGGEVSIGTKTPFMLTEKWTDACVEEKDGLIQQLRRTISSSRISVPKQAISATKQEGTVWLLTRSDKRCTAKAEKGKPDKLSEQLMQKSPPDLMELLLPDVEVSEGDVWEVETLDVMDIQVAACAGKAGAQGPARNALAEDIEDLDGSDSPMGAGMGTSAAILVKATLKSVKDKVATIEFKEDDTMSRIPEGAMPPGMPKAKTTVEGVLTFNIETGMPIQLVWHQKHIHEEQEVEGGSIPGFTEDWALTRKYTK